MKTNSLLENLSYDGHVVSKTFEVIVMLVQWRVMAYSSDNMDLPSCISLLFLG